MIKKKSYYFIGIKGSGMSALANVLHHLGHEVSGSDIDDYVFTEKNLRKNNIPIYSFAALNITPEIDVVVKGAVFNAENNIEVKTAEENNKAILTYHEMLRDLSNAHTSVAITGTHGKTTTTGMLVSAFADEDIAYLIGDGTGSGEEKSEYFLFESCEYKRHFLAYTPDYQIVNNIDFDHPDYFADIDDVVDAFVSSGLQTKKKIVAFGDDVNVRKMQEKLAGQKDIVLFGEAEDNDYVVANYTETANGIEFELSFHGEKIGVFSFPFYGKHMMYNSVATLIIAHLENKDLEKIANNLSKFTGVDRRFNVIEKNGFILVDDYAHHPNEIRVTISAAKQKFPTKEIVAVFQPHTFSRTNTLAEDFSKELAHADKVYVTDIFTSAREQGEDVYPQIILNKIPGAKHLEKNNLNPLLDHKNAVIVFMGAGNIQDYIRELQENIDLGVK